MFYYACLQQAQPYLGPTQKYPQLQYQPPLLLVTDQNLDAVFDLSWHWIEI